MKRSCRACNASPALSPVSLRSVGATGIIICQFLFLQINTDFAYQDTSKKVKKFESLCEVSDIYLSCCPDIPTGVEKFQTRGNTMTGLITVPSSKPVKLVSLPFFHAICNQKSLWETSE